MDKLVENENLQKDLLDYINHRVNNSKNIQNNVTPGSSKQDGSVVVGTSTQSLNRFSHHLLNLSQGSFLFAKLTLDLLEKGHLVVKSSSYKVNIIIIIFISVIAIRLWSETP